LKDFTETQWAQLGKHPFVEINFLNSLKDKNFENVPFICGLKNPDTICALNSCIQTLVHITPLTNVFDNTKIHNYRNSNCDSGESCSICLMRGIVIVMRKNLYNNFCLKTDLGVVKRLGGNKKLKNFIDLRDTGVSDATGLVHEMFIKSKRNNYEKEGLNLLNL